MASAKGYVTGNGPADRLVEQLRGSPGDRWSQEEAARLVEWKRAIRAALPKIMTAERNRTIASLRGRLERRNAGTSQVPAFVWELLDEMEGAS